MLIPEPYTDILKRPDLLLLRVGFFLVMWMVTACVVTDEIAFYDKVNMPPQLESEDPSSDIIEVISNGDKEKFTVTLWEPDEKDAGKYRGEIRVIEELNSGQIGAPGSDICDSVSTFMPDSEKYDGGIMVAITCTADYDLENAPEKTTVVVEVVINDRESDFSNQDEARQLTVSWTREMYPEHVE